MTATDASTSHSPARWAPDPEVRGQLRYRDGARWTPHTAIAITTSRPELPPWFHGATKWLHAVCALTAFAFLASAAVAIAFDAPVDLVANVCQLMSTVVAMLLFLAGGWAYTLVGSRRVDRTALHRDPVWLLVAWFVPVIHVTFTYQLFGEIWASARRVRTQALGSPTSITAPRPWVIHAWAWAWTLSSGGLVLLWLGGLQLETLLPWHLVANSVMLALLGGVVHVIARELAETKPM